MSRWENTMSAAFVSLCEYEDNVHFCSRGSKSLALQRELLQAVEEIHGGGLLWSSLWRRGGIQGVPSNNGSKTASIRPCSSTTVINDHCGSQTTSTCNAMLPSRIGIGHIPQHAKGFATPNIDAIMDHTAAPRALQAHWLRG